MAKKAALIAPVARTNANSILGSPQGATSPSPAPQLPADPTPPATSTRAARKLKGVNINEDLARAAKLAAVNTGTSITHLVETALTEYLTKIGHPPKP